MAAEFCAGWFILLQLINFLTPRCVRYLCRAGVIQPVISDLSRMLHCDISALDVSNDI